MLCAGWLARERQHLQSTLGDDNASVDFELLLFSAGVSWEGVSRRNWFCSTAALLLDIQTFLAARYSNFSGCSIFKVSGSLDIQKLWAARNLSDCSIFKVFELLDIQGFRAAQYSKF